VIGVGPAHAFDGGKACPDDLTDAILAFWRETSWANCLKFHPAERMTLSAPRFRLASASTARPSRAKVQTGWSISCELRAV
jgi:hypothetical protein